MVTKHRTAVNEGLMLYKVESYNRCRGFEDVLILRSFIWTSNFNLLLLGRAAGGVVPPQRQQREFAIGN